MNCQKHLFSLKPDIHYLNCAYKAPLLKSAEEAGIKALLKLRNPADISENDFFEDTEKVRVAFGKIINANPRYIAVVPSASYGFSSVLNNIAGKPNGHAITIKDEFPSGYFSLKRWCRQNDNELFVVQPDNEVGQMGASWNDNILNKINDHTSLVLISSVHWMNGLRFRLKEIGEKCEAVGAKFIVDGTQSVGACHIDVRAFKIHALVCASYKWLFGPYGLALAYIGPYFENGIPLEESWMNRLNAKKFSTLTDYEEKYQAGAGKYNVGETSNFILMPVLLEALEQIIKWNPEHIQEYCKKLIQPLVHYLESLKVKFEREPYFSNHLFSLQLPRKINISTLRENLIKNNIYISVRGNYLRVSVNVFNDEYDIDKLIGVIQKTVGN